jgi:hypothetical protein
LRNDLAELYRAQGCYGEAEPLYKRDLAITEKARGPDHSDVGASVKDVPPVPYSVGQQRNTKRVRSFLNAGQATVCGAMI